MMTVVVSCIEFVLGCELRIAQIIAHGDNIYNSREYLVLQYHVLYRRYRVQSTFTPSTSYLYFYSSICTTSTWSSETVLLC